MASLDDAEETLRSTRTKANFQRLTRLLMRGGAVLLREIFDSYHSPASLPTILSRPSVEIKLKKARLTGPDWKCLYPSPGVYGKSSDFDISLTFRLLRTICRLTPPLTGWDSLPNDSDHSLEADLARIKFYRNEVYGHTKNLEIPDDQFDDLWRQISESLLRIAASLSSERRSNWKDAIDKFLLEPLTPEEERYAEELALWYEKDLDLKKLVQDLTQKSSQKEKALQELIKEEFRVIKDDVRGQQVATLQLVNTIERIAPFGLVVAPGEMQGNQQEIPAEVDIWNVIMAFRDSFSLLFGYLRNKLNAFVEDIKLGSLSITVKCSSLHILEELWEDYMSGHLNRVVQETLVTHEVLENLGLDELKLKVFISEEEYEKGKEVFADDSAKRQILSNKGEEGQKPSTESKSQLPRKGTYSEREEKELGTELQVKELANLKRQVEELAIKLLSSEKERETLVGMCEALKQEQRKFHYQKKRHSVSLESEVYQDILRKHTSTLVRDLEPTRLMLHLDQMDIIDENDGAKIRSTKTRRDMNEALLTALTKRGAKAFRTLVEGLQKFQPSLACILLQEETSSLSNKVADKKRQTVGLESELGELKIKLDLAEREKSTLLIKCEALETETKELKIKLKNSESDVNILLIRCKNLEEQLELSLTLQDTNLESPSHHKNDTPASELRKSSSQGGLPIAGSGIRETEEWLEKSKGRRSRRSLTKLGSAATREYHFWHEGDFDTKGVIHYLGFNAGVNMWLNPARVPSSGVKVTYCDGNGRGDPENILEYFTPVNSSTRSGWCLDLGDYYTLRLTDYTLRQLGGNDRNFLQNFELLGRLCNDDDWCLLGRHHRVDWRSQRFSHMLSGKRELSYKTKTWSVKGEVRAYRQFKIVQIKDMLTRVPGTLSMSLAGIELYGVLSVPYLD